MVCEGLGRRKYGRKGKQSLNEEMKNALSAVLRDPKASPTARAIAGRSLVQLMGRRTDAT